MNKLCMSLAIGCAMLALGAPAFAQTTTYRIEVVSDHSDEGSFRPSSFYERHKFIGSVGPTQEAQAAIKRADQSLRLLPRLTGADACFASASDAAGTVFGICSDSGTEVYQAFRWTAPTGTVQIPTQPASADSADIADSNSWGLAIGESWKRDPVTGHIEEFWPIYIDADGTMKTLPKTGYGARAASVNEQGVIVGHDYNVDLSVDAVAWRDGVMERLPKPREAGSAHARQINDALQIVGTYYRLGGGDVPIRWNLVDKSYKVLRLPDVPRNHYTTAQGFLPNGDILVNTIRPDDFYQRVFVWRSNSESKNLDDLIDPADPYHGRFHATFAYKANKRGEILVTGRLDGVSRGMLLIPVRD